MIESSASFAIPTTTTSVFVVVQFQLNWLARSNHLSIGPCDDGHHLSDKLNVKLWISSKSRFDILLIPFGQLK